MNDPNVPSGALNFEQDFKQLLESLMGVFSAKVFLDESGDITEIHVLASASRNVKQIVRDIRSALNAHFNLDVDHKLISVAQLKENPVDGPSPIEAPAQSASPQQSRLRLGRLVQSVENNNYEVSLTLKYNGELFEGIATSRNSLQQRCMCVANATLDAVHNFLGQSGLFSLSGVQRITSTPMPMFMVIIECTQQPSGLLVGTAEIGVDEAMSIERATLNAVNRKLTALAEADLF